MIISLVALAAIVIVGIYIMPYIEKPWVWFIMSCICFFICLGGFVHNYLHNVPLVGTERDENGDQTYELFSTGSREQYGLEGYIISFLMLLMGSCMIFLTYLPKLDFKKLSE